MSNHYQDLNNATYNNSAHQLAEYFTGIGARTEDIDRALRLAHKPHDARVVEIGCGDGRDAVEITKRVAFYQGFDPSSGMLALAQAKLPNETFINATATSFQYPDNLDVVFAFASLLHVPKEELKAVFEKVQTALRDGGIFYISTKESPEYKEEIKKDKFGERMFYFYNVPFLEERAGSSFVKVHEDHQMAGSTPWLTVALQKWG